ncbi:MAG TPA: M20/M25/M40 family metallo-hydrolase [Longimicrobiales bacterium]|nr:M20/M25/M40 family metallo-hydrolase [Longimicrobiales bacterium]
MRRIIFTAGLFLLATGTSRAAAQDTAASTPTAAGSIQADQIRAHLSFLADDALEGRAPGRRGARIAARYIVSQLVRAGIEPAAGGYYQTVPLLGWTADARRVSVQYAAGDSTGALAFPDDAVVWLDSGADSARASANVVFAGYGVHAPEYDWDDYKDVDVRGRIVLVLSGDPPAPPGEPLIFDGGAMTYYGRYTYKIEQARSRGAAAIIIVHTTDGAGYAWPVVQSSWLGEQLALPQDSAAAASVLQIQAWVTFGAARRMLGAVGLDLDELYVRAARRDFQPISTGITVQLRAGGRARRFESSNVVGIVQGRHPTRRGEAVIFTAHYDHLGIGPPVDGDSIYNGAYDNASGVALLLEVAEAFARQRPRPERSVLFLFSTAEEAGMLGAAWYVRQPLIPLRRTVAALNIDGANLWGETDDVSAVGLERSTLGAVFEQQAAFMGLRVEAERAPDKGFFFRSDHFPFARAGVPALYLDHGIAYRDRPPDWGMNTLARYEAERYHQPGDEYDSAFDLAGAVQQGRHAFLVGLDIANAETAPRWYPGGAISR